MLNLTALETLTTQEERAELFSAVRQTPKLRVEKPQSDFNGGWIRMWTVLTPYYDAKGFNRQYSTFSIMGLTEIGLIKGDK